MYEKRSEKLTLKGYVDSDFAGDRDSRKSTTVCFFTLGDNCITWKSQLQPLVTLSSTDAEYVAIIEAVKECIWLKGILKELNFMHDKPIMFTDSQRTLSLSKNPVYHERSKHIEVKHHFIHEKLSQGKVEFVNIHTDRIPSDVGTKIQPVGKFKLCLSLLHIDICKFFLQVVGDNDEQSFHGQIRNRESVCVTRTNVKNVSIMVLLTLLD